MMIIDYQEAKRRVSIIEILVGWGYRFDKSKGAVSPNFVLRNEHGQEIDRIIITNPKDPERQGFWRRNGSKGDLIAFIKENLERFPVVGRNEVDTVNNVLAHLMALPLPTASKKFDLEAYLDRQGIKEPKPFNLANLQRKAGTEHVELLMPFFIQRGISRETVETFAPWIELVRKDSTLLPQSGQGDPWNVGFPYCTPGSDEIVGYELRGHHGFKGKAEGTNSCSALWLADPLSPTPSPHTVAQVREVYFFESALDAMAFWQVNHNEHPLSQAVFASTGGSFSDQQVTSTMAYYHHAKAVDCFDNDLQGRLYGIRLVALLERSREPLEIRADNDLVRFRLGERDYELAPDLADVATFRAMTATYADTARTWKAPEGCKDWNDVLLR